MTDDDIRRDDAADPEHEPGTELDYEPEPRDHPPGYEPDPHAAMLRGLPRLRHIETDIDKKIFVPPPPTVSRIGGLSQGCGGLLLTIMGVMMLVVAVWFGYYLWGPGLILGGGVILIFGTKGVWAGRKNAVIVSTSAILIVAVIAYFWQSFIPAAGALSPIGAIGVFLAPASMLITLILSVTLITNVVALFYWKRLKELNPRGLVIWGSVAAVLIVLAMGAHFAQQQARQNWLNDQFDSYTAEASDNVLIMGSNSNVTLGYSFVTVEEGDDPRMDIRLAEFDAGIEAGASLIRMSASGDMLQEAEVARMFPLDEDADDPEEEAQKAADRLVRQQEVEQLFMDHVLESGVDLLISDAQYSPYMLVWSSDEDADVEFTWESFTELQAERIEHYASTLQPAFYEIVNEPRAYSEFSGVESADDEELLELWIAQTERLIAIVEDVSPDTQIGVAISLGEDFDLEFYTRVLEFDGIDFIGLRAFQPAAFDRIEEIIAEQGHPADFGKELWIMETWYGYCLAPQRSMDLDATWLEVAAAFAASHNISTVLASDYGCFVQEGGTLFQDIDDLESRTDVWQRWQELIVAWQE